MPRMLYLITLLALTICVAESASIAWSQEPDVLPKPRVFPSIPQSPSTGETPGQGYPIPSSGGSIPPNGAYSPPSFPNAPPVVGQAFPPAPMTQIQPVVKVYRLKRYPVSRVKSVFEQLKDSYIENQGVPTNNPFAPMTGNHGPFPGVAHQAVIMQRPDGTVGVVDLNACVFSVNERANAVVFRTSSKTKMKRVDQLIAVLETAPKKALPKVADLLVLRLKHATPSDIEKTLEPLKLQTQVVCFDPAKLIFVVGQKNSREQLQKVIEQLDVPAPKLEEPEREGKKKGKLKEPECGVLFQDNSTVAIRVLYSKEIPKVEQVQIGRELPIELGKKLQHHFGAIKKTIQVVPSYKVRNFQAKNPDSPSYELGKGVEADYVIDLYIRKFSLYQPKTHNMFYKGQAEIKLALTDTSMAPEVGPIYDTDYICPAFPKYGQKLVEESDYVFRRHFVERFAEEISRHFAPTHVEE